MKKNSRESQIKTVNHIKAQLGAYTRWKLCGTKAKFFTKSEIENHLWNLNLINTITQERKIARKSGQLMRLLAAVLKREFDKDSPVHIPQHRYIRTTKEKNGKTGLSARSEVPSRRRNTLPYKNGTATEKVPKLL